MAIDVTKDGVRLDLPRGFAMQVDESNPIFNDRGSMSLPATVPATVRNNRALGFAARLDTAGAATDAQVTVADGAWMRTGVLNITGASPRGGISFNVGFDNSVAYAKWREKKLGDLSCFPVLSGDGQKTLMQKLRDIYTAPDDDEPLACFEVQLSVDSYKVKGGEGELAIRTIAPPAGTIRDDSDTDRDIETSTRRVYEVRNSERMLITVPKRYGVGVYLRVWKLVELVFEDLGLTMTGVNPFASGDLRKLVVLNNVMDACCRDNSEGKGFLDFADLAPTCTVEEFLNALWCRFGFVYRIDYDAGTVETTLIDNILKTGATMAIDHLVTNDNEIGYQGAKYIKMTAEHHIEGTEPVAATFEEWMHDKKLAKLCLFADVDGKMTVPDGMGGSRYYDFGLEPVTGRWRYRYYDYTSHDLTSSSFFDWDPKTEGMEAEELSSPDIWVPMTKMEGEYYDTMPDYRVGQRFRHSVARINGETKKTDEKGETPLAFALAYTIQVKTIGRICSEKVEKAGDIAGDALNNVGTISPSHLTSQGLSLLFWSKTGLYNTYWRRYDELLRHGNRTVSVTLRLPKSQLRQLNMFRPVTYKGIRCLFDTISYSLDGDSPYAVADVQLRTIQATGEYDIDTEAPVPDFDAVGIFKWQPVQDFDERLLEVLQTSELGWRVIDWWLESHPSVNRGDVTATCLAVTDDNTLDDFNYYVKTPWKTVSERLATPQRAGLSGKVRPEVMVRFSIANNAQGGARSEIEYPLSFDFFLVSVPAEL